MRATPDRPFLHIFIDCMSACSTLENKICCNEGQSADLLFLPIIPPRMHKGMVTRAQMTKITTMVPNGRA